MAGRILEKNDNKQEVVLPLSIMRSKDGKKGLSEVIGGWVVMFVCDCNIKEMKGAELWYDGQLSIGQKLFVICNTLDKHTVSKSF